MTLLCAGIVSSSALAQDQAHIFNWADTRTVDNEVCLSCHADKGLKPITERGRTLTLFVEKRDFIGSFHKRLACVDCHQGAETFAKAPHNGGLPLRTECGYCHTREAEAYKTSVHGELAGTGDKEVATCASCHGKHDILPSTDVRSFTNKFVLYKTCGKCHNPDGVTGRRDVSEHHPMAKYVDSIHGRAVQKYGLFVAPTCNDCHGSHDIQRRETGTSSINRSKIPKTCSKCHVLAASVYRESIHGRLLAKNDKRAPTCVDCHSAHEITAAVPPEFSAGIDRKCGPCHKDKLSQYRETIHGKEAALGRSDVASCDDCHGAHDILPSKDPGSHTNENNRLAACRRCHPKASPNFAEYKVHAVHTDKASSPETYWTFVILGAALLFVVGAFAVHLILWVIRAMVRFGTLRSQMRSLHAEIAVDKVTHVRFSPIDRLLHLLTIFSFFLLFTTGMPLKLYYTDWAKTVLSWYRGPEVAAQLHRVGAFVLLSIIAIHMLTLFSRLWQRRAEFKDAESRHFSLRQFFLVVFGPDSFWLRFQDFKDYLAYQKWLFGKGERPRFDRWTYWEKINYHTVAAGVLLISISGLILWFPETATIFLPGWSINLAQAVHSDIALLATGFILTFHYFSAHLRVEKFPFDPVIFSGRVTRSELSYERPKLLERLEIEKPLQNTAAGGLPRWVGRLIIAAEIAVFLVGLLTVVFVYWTVISRFLHG
jgi:cytochrome b subunit of formate dehydrogenase